MQTPRLLVERDVQCDETAVRNHRRGVATMYLIIALPVLLLLFAIVTDIGHLWLARIELKTATEAGALAGAQRFTQADTTDARLAARTYTEANTVRGQSFQPVLNQANSGSTNTNQNEDINGEIVLGAAGLGGGNFTFDPNTEPDPGSGLNAAARVRLTVTIPSLWNSMFGVPLGPYSITAQAHAQNDNGVPRLFAP